MFAGVAYNCRILPVYDGASSDRIALAIDWARQNGASIISMSSSYGENNTINTAIDNATTIGRDGLGCIVVASSGNNFSTTVNYPARHPNVIAVGAIDNNGIRASNSNCGDNIDVVAPGVGIYTTDLQGAAGYNTTSGLNGNYFSNFDGTSAACPHVSGIAALILSIRPDLTAEEVRYVIESTCTKVNQGTTTGKYNYTNDSSHPNSTWNSYVGYGLVNAYEAVSSVEVTLSSDRNLLCYGFSAEVSVSNPPASFTWEASSNLQITGTGSTIYAQATSGTSDDEGTLEWVSIMANGVEVARKEIWVGPPNVTGITGPDYTSSSSPGRYYAVYNPLSEPTFYWFIDYEWYPYPYQIYSYGDYADVRFYSSGGYILEAEACNSCGCIEENVEKAIYAYLNSPSPVSSYPNPVRDILNLEINQQAANDLQRSSATTYEIHLYNQYGTKLRTATITNGGKEQLDLSYLKDGTYFLHIYDGVNPVPEKRQIIVKH